MKKISFMMLCVCLFLCRPVHAANYPTLSGTTLATLNDGDTVGTLQGVWAGTTSITTMNGGTITKLQGKWNNPNTGYTFIENMNGGTVVEFEGAYDGQTYINYLSGGSVDLMTKDAVVKNLSGTAVIDRMIDSTKITTMSGGTVNSMTNGALVGTMTGGTVKKMAGAANVGSMSGGTIESMQEGAFVTTLSGGGTVKEMIAGAYVKTMAGGIIESMTGGTAVHNLTDGTIERMDEYSKIGQVTLGPSGEVLSVTGSMTGGTIKEMTGYATVHVDMQGGTVENMYDQSNIKKLSGGIVENMYDSSRIDAMTSGTVENMAGGTIVSMTGGNITKITNGTVGDLGAGATIGTIENATIYGNVANGTALNVTQGKTLNLFASNTGKTFDRSVNTGDGASVYVKDYTLGTNAAFNMGNRGTLYFGTPVDVQKVSFAGSGTLDIASSSSGVFNKTTIQDFSAGGQITFKFFVDENVGGLNDELVIVSNTGTVNNHLIQVLSNHVSSEGRSLIDLIDDQSGTLSFQLANGNQVGLGAWNYSLVSSAGTLGNNIWSLSKQNSLSDAATNIASIATANLTSAQSLQNALHKRMGDIRLQNTEGVWTRTYTHQTKFNDLAKTRVQNYAIETGYDKEIMDFENSSVFLGVGIGVNYAHTTIDAENAKDGGGNTTMPYVGIYGTWHLNNGLYMDAIVRYAYNDTDAYYYDGSNTKQEYKVNNHIGNVSFEVGYQYNLTDRFILEPRTELSYTYVKNDSFVDDTGIRAKYGVTHSLLGTMGMIARYDFGGFESYAKLSYLYEFDGRTDIRYDDAKFDSDVRGARGEVALGITGNVKEDTFYFAELGFQGGQQSFINYNANIGIRWNF